MYASLWMLLPGFAAMNGCCGRRGARHRLRRRRRARRRRGATGAGPAGRVRPGAAAAAVPAEHQRGQRRRGRQATRRRTRVESPWTSNLTVGRDAVDPACPVEQNRACSWPGSRWPLCVTRRARALSACSRRAGGPASPAPWPRRSRPGRAGPDRAGVRGRTRSKDRPLPRARRAAAPVHGADRARTACTTTPTRPTPTPAAARAGADLTVTSATLRRRGVRDDHVRQPRPDRRAVRQPRRASSSCSSTRTRSSRSATMTTSAPRPDLRRQPAHRPVRRRVLLPRPPRPRHRRDRRRARSWSSRSPTTASTCAGRTTSSPAIPEGDCLIALMPDWDGRIWFVTKDGGVGTVDPAHRHGPQRCGSTASAIVNSFATDETGGVFIVSDHALYRFDAGRRRHPEGHLARGLRPRLDAEARPAVAGARAPRRPSSATTSWSSPTTPTRGCRWCRTGAPPTASRDREVCREPVFARGAERDREQHRRRRPLGDRGEQLRLREPEHDDARPLDHAGHRARRRHPARAAGRCGSPTRSRRPRCRRCR